MRTKFQEVCQLIQEVNKTSVLSLFRTDPTPHSKSLYPTPTKNIFSTPAAFLDSITSFSKYFMSCRSNSGSGTLWTQTCILHSEPIENIVANTRTDLKEMDTTLSVQSTQH